MKNYNTKIFVLAMVTLMSLCMVSCSKDDDGGISSPLVGAWAQEHYDIATHYYFGFKLDSNGNASYFEWKYGEEPNWNYTTGGRWNVTGNVLSVYEPDGTLIFSSEFSLSEDNNTITFVSGTSKGYSPNMLEGSYVRYTK